jgi:hypothetical protein
MDPKNLPNEIDIESTILGIYITFPETQEELSNTLQENDFYDRRTLNLFKYIYTYIRSNDGDVTHTDLILNYLKNDDKILKDCGGSKFIADEVISVGTKAGLKSIIEKLKDLSKRRTLIAKCQDIISNCYQTLEVPISEIVEDMRIVLDYSESRNLAQQLKDWVDNISGTFSVTNCDNELQIVTKKDKANRRQILLRLEKQRVIEKTGRIAGEYRKIENDYECEDWLNADESPIKIDLPLGLTQYCMVYPGDVIVFAGSKSAGKSALALDTIRRNRRNFPLIFYHSSELNKNTFKRRLSKLDNFRPDEWLNVKFIGELAAETSHDRVQAGTLNIFDYLEVDDGSHYKIPGMITKIHRRLKGGVALICLQKDTVKKFAVGGEQTRAKANLYCMLQPDYPGEKLIIDNCKAWAQEDINPAGFEIHYKIHNGINIYPQGSLSPGLARGEKMGVGF